MDKAAASARQEASEDLDDYLLFLRWLCRRRCAPQGRAISHAQRTADTYEADLRTESGF